MLVSHRSLMQGAFAVANYLEITCEDRLLCALPLSFDAGFIEAMTALVSGALQSFTITCARWISCGIALLWASLG